MNAIDTILAENARIQAGGIETCRPGQPVYITTAWAVGDCVRQGDVQITVVESPDADYTPATPFAKLAFGDTQGARHCLDSLDGVEMWLPPNWSEESLAGPIVRCLADRVVTHPEHGHVHIPAGTTVAIDYQRNFDAEQQRARRAMD